MTFSRHPDRRNDGSDQPSRRGILTLEDGIAALACHRAEIITTLAYGGTCAVEALSRRLTLERSKVSHQMENLVALGILKWTRSGTAHEYALSPGVRAFKEAGMVQVSLLARNGDWLFMHRYHGDSGGRVVLPPSSFLDVEHL